MVTTENKFKCQKTRTNNEKKMMRISCALRVKPVGLELRATDVFETSTLLEIFNVVV